MGKKLTVEVELGDAEITWRCLAGACARIDRDIRDLERALSKFGTNDPARARYHARISELDQGYKALYALVGRVCQAAEAAKQEVLDA